MRRIVPQDPWHDVEVLPRTESTNALLRRDPRPWRVVLADHQTSGRGRLERPWEAPPGVGIALSATLPLPQDQSRWGWVPLLVGVAARRAVLRTTGVDVRLKWPNDLLVEVAAGQWRKVGGILCEASTHDGVPVVVAGIGINVWQQAEDLPTPNATSLALNGARADRETIVAALLEELERTEREWHDPFIGAEYRSSCVTIGQQVRVQTGPDDFHEGEALDVDDLGRLVVRDEDGTTAHSVGDVVHVRPIEAPTQPPATERAQFVDTIEERLMRAPRELRRGDVSRLAEVPEETARDFWRALGFANARDDDVVFSHRDVAALRRMMDLIESGAVDRATALSIARAIGRSTDRMEMWLVQIISDMITANQDLGVDTSTAFEVAERMVQISQALTPLIEYASRRNLANAVRRMVADAEPESHIGVIRTVGFCDIVGFTRMVRSMPDQELAELVIRFESMVSDIVAMYDGAVVKTVGDEVLFTHRTVQGGVKIALELIDRIDQNPRMPRLRIGLATGRILARQGDVYGTTVNRASRLTNTAAPGELLVDGDIAEAVQGQPDLRVFDVGPLSLSGMGAVSAAAVNRTGTTRAREENA